MVATDVDSPDSGGMANLAPPPWSNCFEDPDRPGTPAAIGIQQISRTTFLLETSLKYTGDTGVPGLPPQACVLRPADLGDPAVTDLASVPVALRWFVGSYGVHTPAALLHDRLIGPTNTLGVPDAQADRFFRFMLTELGVRFLRRWMMWTAVAFGTRWRTTRLRRLLIVWLLVATVGMSSFIYGIATSNWALVAVATVAPLPASALWGKQYGAGLTAAATAVWVLPPTIMAAVGYGIYRALEGAVSMLPLTTPVKGSEPADYRHF